MKSFQNVYETLMTIVKIFNFFLQANLHKQHSVSEPDISGRFGTTFLNGFLKWRNQMYRYYSSIRNIIVKSRWTSSVIEFTFFSKHKEYNKRCKNWWENNWNSKWLPCGRKLTVIQNVSLNMPCIIITF